MKQCEVCQGFLPNGATMCPHCDEPARSGERGDASGTGRLLQIAVLSSSLVTLMACYGGPTCDDLVDKDQDGAFVCAYSARPGLGDDCDDANPARRPGVPDPLGDGVDQNCDGVDGIRSLVSASPSGSSSASPQRLWPSAGLSSSASPAPSGSAAASTTPSSPASPTPSSSAAR